MEKRKYTKRSEMSSDDIKDRIRKQKRESKQRAKIRKQAEKLGITVPSKLYVNEGKTAKQIRQRKADLNKVNRIEAKYRVLELDFIDQIERTDLEVNKHYMKKYLKFVLSDHKAQIRTEAHHILPKSLFPKFKNSKSNIVDLPLRAHFMAHRLLAKALPENEEMRFAVYRMSKYSKYKNKMSKSEDNQYQIEASEFLRNIQVSRVKNNTHPLQGERNPVHKQVKDGTHIFLGGKLHRELAAKGVHPCQNNGSPSYKAVQKGTHLWLNVKPWNHNRATETSRLTWILSDEAYIHYKNDITIGRLRLYNLIQKQSDLLLSKGSAEQMLYKFRSGWIPEQDPEWIKFKQEKES